MPVRTLQEMENRWEDRIERNLERLSIKIDELVAENSRDHGTTAADLAAVKSDINALHLRISEILEESNRKLTSKGKVIGALELSIAALLAMIIEAKFRPLEFLKALFG